MKENFNKVSRPAVRDVLLRLLMDLSHVETTKAFDMTVVTGHGFEVRKLHDTKQSGQSEGPLHCAIVHCLKWLPQLVLERCKYRQRLVKITGNLTECKNRRALFPLTGYS